MSVYDIHQLVSCLFCGVFIPETNLVVTVTLMLINNNSKFIEPNLKKSDPENLMSLRAISQDLIN